MRVAIVHYHLRPGGVTRVIESAVSALAETDVRVAILCGEPPPSELNLSAPVRVIPGLDYTPTGAHPQPQELIREMETAATTTLGGPPDVWHFHNHALGKNAALTRAVFLMAGQGQHLLLQIHDFAEDGRPHLFDTLLRYVGESNLEQLSRIMYPIAPHIHYAAINRRDTRLMVQAGAPYTRVHFLPNAITLRVCSVGPWDSAPPPPRLLVYPVRAIRRKNLGEAILWCCALRDEIRVAVTLAPKSASDRAAYDAWVDFARTQELPIDFEVGQPSSTAFEEYLASAWMVLTTSIAEGFGMTFLEPWLAGRPVVGRDIPAITQDFKKNGIALPNLYPALRVPVHWLPRHELESRLHATYADFLSRYRRTATSSLLEALQQTYFADDRVDFGRLDEQGQRQVIERILARPSEIHRVEPAALIRDLHAAHRALKTNADLIHRHYGREAYRNRLVSAYKAVAQARATSVEGCLKIQQLLDFFLSPAAFWMIRT